MSIENELLNAVPAPDPAAIFLDRHTPPGLFQGTSAHQYWIVETGLGKRAITLSECCMPQFAVFTLSDRRLDFGWTLGKPTLHLDVSIPSIERDDVGIVATEDFGISMQCQRPDGSTEQVLLGVYEPTQLTGLFFSGWRVFAGADTEHPVAEREPFYYHAEPFEPEFEVECGERLNIVVNCVE